jgi:hypothetical protein
MGDLWIIRNTQFFPLPCGSKPIKVEKGPSIQGGTGSSQDAAESDQGFFVDLISAHQILVIAEIPQEPSQFPEGFGGAIEPPSNGMAQQVFGFEDSEAKDKEGSLRMPAVEGSLDADQEDAFQDIVSVVIFAMKSGDVAFHFRASSGLA